MFEVRLLAGAPLLRQRLPSVLQNHKAEPLRQFPPERRDNELAIMTDDLLKSPLAEKSGSSFSKYEIKVLLCSN
jgi:hypothetical protein